MAIRPSITGGLEERVKEIYEEEGFDKPGDLVRYAVRREVDERRRRNNE